MIQAVSLHIPKTQYFQINQVCKYFVQFSLHIQTLLNDLASVTNAGNSSFTRLQVIQTCLKCNSKHHHVLQPRPPFPPPLRRGSGLMKTASLDVEGVQETRPSSPLWFCPSRSKANPGCVCGASPGPSRTVGVLSDWTACFGTWRHHFGSRIVPVFACPEMFYVPLSEFPWRFEWYFWIPSSLRLIEFMAPLRLKVPISEVHEKNESEIIKCTLNNI